MLSAAASALAGPLGGAAAAACVGARHALLQHTRGLLWSVEREKVRAAAEGPLGGACTHRGRAGGRAPAPAAPRRREPRLPRSPRDSRRDARRVRMTPPPPRHPAPRPATAPPQGHTYKPVDEIINDKGERGRRAKGCVRGRCGPFGCPACRARRARRRARARRAARMPPVRRSRYCPSW
jgi:hypothetical protein